MPTGYTAGILDGKIKTFPEFAKICMRAFGATIHMRDDDLDKPYVPRTPSDYHAKNIKAARKEIKKISKMTDEELIRSEEKKLKKEKKYHEERIEERRNNFIVLGGMLTSVKQWEPPTQDHYGLKDFMKEQITKTIDFDCDTEYNEKELSEIKEKLKNLNASIIRAARKKEAEDDLSYHLKEYQKEIERCAGSNKWVEELIKSLPNK